MQIEVRLAEIALNNADMREVEPHIYSFRPVDESAYYDHFGGIYEVIACNRYYNRLVWGYSISEYSRLCADALQSAKDEWVLDAGCGSLAFTAKTYIRHVTRPTVLFDQSVRMLRLAKSRIIKLSGSVPGNMVFVQGDVTGLPFKDRSIGTVIALNLFHAVPETGTRTMLSELRRVMSERGSMTLTTLVKNNRLADKYIDKLGKLDALVPRSVDQLHAIFENFGMPVKYLIKGNLAFVHHGRTLNYLGDNRFQNSGANP